MTSNLTLNFTNPTSSAQDDLLLEQKEWNPKIGFVTKVNFINFIGGMMYGENTGDGWDAKINCGVDDNGSFRTTIYVYPFNPSLSYRIDTTYGSLGERIINPPVYKQEVIGLKLEDEASLKYPLRFLAIVEAVGDLYDRNGNIIALNQVSITMTGTKIKLSQKVYGSIGIRYYTTQHEYSLSVDRRDIDVTTENFYSAVVYAWWNGGVKWLDTEAPPGAEARAKDISECGWGDHQTLTPHPHEKKRPEAAGADRKITISYCTGETINDSVFGNDG